MLELVCTIALVFVAVIACTIFFKALSGLFQSEGLGQIDMDRQRPGVSFYENIQEKKTILL